jgi:hypothetical protein
MRAAGQRATATRDRRETWSTIPMTQKGHLPRRGWGARGLASQYRCATTIALIGSIIIYRQEVRPFVKDVPHAPIVYFEGAPSFGINNGIVNVTLAIVRNLPDGQGGVAQDVIAVAYLRCNMPAAIELRKVLDDAILLGAKTEGKAN